MHHAKQLGRNNYQFHTADMNAQALAMLLTEQGLRRALERQEFLLHFQPQLDTRTGRIVGAEALIRWRHPERGMVSPQQFIPIAEERGLIVPIGTWVLREACRQNRAWQAAGMPPISIAINLSALQFQQKDLVQEVERALRDGGLAAEYLDLELTESAVMHDAEDSIATMHALKSIGLKLSLDDFGTGYSSLSQLKRFPLDKLKIDQSFVRGLPNDRYDLAISTAIIGMGNALNLRLIAEGVETAEQLTALQAIGCHDIQGYFISRPLPATEFAAFLGEPRLRAESDAQTKDYP
jgi:EAL domain-containing protein (putative c-di-GMP-specific phosphodiesterase class I)